MALTSLLVYGKIYSVYNYSTFQKVIFNGYISCYIIFLVSIKIILMINRFVILFYFYLCDNPILRIVAARKRECCLEHWWWASKTSSLLTPGCRTSRSSTRFFLLIVRRKTTQMLVQMTAPGLLLGCCRPGTMLEGRTRGVPLNRARTLYPFSSLEVFLTIRSTRFPKAISPVCSLVYEFQTYCQGVI